MIAANRDPGGGEVVRLTDPNGFMIELLHGITLLPETAAEQHVVNTGADRLKRAGTFYRPPSGPSKVKRIGHFVVGTRDVKATRDWYRDTLGLIGTDDVVAGSEDHIVASFNRLARGDEYVDHHIFMTHEAPEPALNRLGFGVRDFDDIMFGHLFLKEQAAEHR